MGKASSAKKIKRVQQAGVSRAPGQRRNLAYPALIIGIIVVGTVLVWFARESRVSTAEVAPTSSDTWYSPFGTNICGEFQGNFPPKGKDTTGITTNGNGLIKINPKGKANEGAGATFDKFLASVGMTVAEGTLTLPDGTTKRDGEQCGTEAGRVALYVWPPQANDKSNPRVITQAAQINSARFVEDGQIFVLAFTPKGSEAKLPPSVAQLDDPEAKPAKDTSPTTTTTEAGSTTSTTAGGGG
ncbi:MAG: hypothetical protein ACOYOP_04140 [Microthrixaceae bacterium]